MTFIIHQQCFWYCFDTFGPKWLPLTNMFSNFRFDFNLKQKISILNFCLNLSQSPFTDILINNIQIAEKEELYIFNPLIICCFISSRYFNIVWYVYVLITITKGVNRILFQEMLHLIKKIWFVLLYLFTRFNLSIFDINYINTKLI